MSFCIHVQLMLGLAVCSPESQVKILIALNCDSMVRNRDGVTRIPRLTRNRLGWVDGIN